MSTCIDRERNVQSACLQRFGQSLCVYNESVGIADVQLNAQPIESGGGAYKSQQIVRAARHDRAIAANCRKLLGIMKSDAQRPITAQRNAAETATKELDRVDSVLATLRPVTLQAKAPSKRAP